MNITDRERKLIITGGVFFAILVLYFSVSFVQENILSIDEKIAESAAEEKKLAELGNEYRKLSSLKSMERVDLEPMVPFIEGMIQRYGLSAISSIQTNDTVVENKYNKRMVNLNLREVDSANLLNIIKEVENQGSLPMVVELFQYGEIKEKPGYYRVTLRFAAFKNKD